MQVQKYKETEIGIIPEDWNTVQLLDIVDEKSDIVAGPFGSNLKVSDYQKEGIPIIRLQNIDRNKFIFKNIKYISHKKAEELKYHSFISGDIILAKLGDPIGKTCIVPNELVNGIIVADVVRIRVSPKKINKIFIEYILNSKSCIKQLNEEIIGTTRPRVNLSQVRDLKIPLPLLYEQEQIANILFTIDNRLDIVERERQRIERLKVGIMKELFERKKWKIIKFEEICDKIRSGGTPLTSRKEYYNGNIPFVKIEDITKSGKYLIDTKIKISYEGLNNSTAWLVPKNSLLLAIYGSLGEITINKIDVTTNQAILGIILDNTKVDTDYIYYFFKNVKLMRYAKQSTQANLTAEIIRSIEIPLPPLEEQKLISNILNTLDAKLSIQQSKKSKLENIKKSLMNDLLTGKKRVQVHNNGL